MADGSRFGAGVAGFLAAAVLTLTGTSPCSAQQAAPGHLGGPGSVHAQVAEDKEARRQPGPAFPRVPLRDRLEQEFGLVVGADYNALFQHVSERPGSNEAASGVARIYGTSSVYPVLIPA